MHQPSPRAATNSMASCTNQPQAASSPNALQLRHLDTASLQLVANQLGLPPYQPRPQLLKSIQETQCSRLPFAWSVSTLAALPVALYGFSAVEYQGSLFLFGGRSGSSDPSEQCNSDFLCYDPAAGCWKVLQIDTDTIEPRRWHSAVVNGSDMLVFGGQIWNGLAWAPTNSMIAFSFVTRQWRTVQQGGHVPAPMPRHTMAVLNSSKLLVLPGAAPQGGSHVSSLASLATYDMAANKWASQACTGQKFDLSAVEAATSWQGSTYVLVVDEAADRMSIFQLDAQTMAWKEVCASNTPPCSRRQCSAVQVDGMWILSGGVSTAGDAQFVFSDLFTFDLASSSWAQLQVEDEDIPTARASHCATTLSGSAVFLGGWHQRWPGKLDNILMSKQFLEPSQARSTTVANLHIGECLKSVRNRDLFSDLLLVAKDGQEFPAHRIVLASQSVVFEKMLASPMQEAGGRIIIPEASPEMLTVLLDYLYGGSDEVSADIVVELFQFADLYCVQSLKLECIQRLHACISVANVSAIAQIASLHSLEEVWEHCVRFSSSPKHQAEVFASEAYFQLWEDDRNCAKLFTQQVAAAASKRFFELQQAEGVGDAPASAKKPKYTSSME